MWIFQKIKTKKTRAMKKNELEFDFAQEKRNFTIIFFTVFLFCIYILCWFIIQFGSLLEIKTLKVFSNLVHVIYVSPNLQENDVVKIKKIQKTELPDEIQKEFSDSNKNQHCIIKRNGSGNLLGCYYREKTNEATVLMYDFIEINTSVLNSIIQKVFYLSLSVVVVFFLGVFVFFFLRNKKNFMIFELYKKKLDEITKERDFIISENKKIVKKNKNVKFQKNEYLLLKEKLENLTMESQKNQVAMFNMLKDIDEARKEAESASQAKSVFLACMSHELRTPMNGIMGMINSCLDTPLESKQKEFLEVALSSSNMLLVILNEIIDYVKIQDKKLSISSVIFDINKLVEQTVGLFTHQFHEKNIECIIDLDPSIPVSLIGDPDKLQKVLRNVISNALKFTHQGSVVITSNLVNLSTEKASIQFNIIDTGIGISDEQKSHLFKPFHQVDSSITRKYGGMGLGLILSKELVGLMGGQLDFTSELEKGTNFSISIDFNLPPFAENVVYRFGGTLPYKKEIILFCSDHRMLRFFERSLVYLEQKLEIYDDLRIYQKVLEGDGKKIDLIIVDGATLPNIYDLILVNEKNNVKVPIIYIGNHLQEIKENEIVKIHQVLKPITFTMLKSVMNDIFSPEISSESIEDVSVKSAYKFINIEAKILILEDNPVNQIVIKSYLERLGLDYIKVAENGQVALENNDLTKFDLIFSDIQMPVMDGLSFSKYVRQNLKISTQKLPIVALSAHSFAGEKQICYQAGMNDYLAKPVDINLLINCLIRWIPKKASKEIKEKKFDVDQKELSQMKTLLGNAFNKIVSAFISDSTRKREELFEALREANHAKVNSISHQLKSSTGSFGAVSLSEYFRNLEKMSDGGRLPDDIDMTIKEIKEQFDKLFAILSEDKH